MGGAFMAVNGPMYLLHEGEVVKLGFRVEPRHCNPAGTCHGGMLASFADMLLPHTVHRKQVLDGTGLLPVPGAEPQAVARGHFLPTINLQLDYMAPARVGDWVEGQAQVLSVTGGMVFVQGVITSGGKVALRCSGVFKIGPLMTDLKPIKTT
jgi:acyl-coenzyme A thioesterase PaaI-like protein